MHPHAPLHLQKVVRHPSYKSLNGRFFPPYDIALLVLNKPAKTKPAALAPANFKMPTGSGMGEYLWVAGWGKTEDEDRPEDLR